MKILVVGSGAREHSLGWKLMPGVHSALDESEKILVDIARGKSC